MTAVAASPAWPFPTIEHLSPASLDKLQSCPEKWRLYYLEGKRERKGVNLVIGGAVDKAYRWAYEAKIKTAVPKPGEVDELLEIAFDSEIAFAGDESEIAWGESNYSAAKDTAASLVTAYRPVFDRTTPVAVNEKVSIDVPGLPVPVIGYIDVRTPDSVIDLKTAKSKPAGGELQPGWRLAAMIYRAATGLRVDYHVGTKVKTPVWWTPDELPGLSLPAQHDRALVDRMLGRRAQTLHAYLALFGADGPWPDAIGREAFHSAACSYCAFRENDCAWWREEAA